MSFYRSIKITHNKPYQYKNLKIRKETDSKLAIHSNHNLRTSCKRASVFTSKGSLSVEAAIVIPLFFLAVLCFAFVLEMTSMRLRIRGALYCAGMEIAQETYLYPFVSGYAVRRKVVNAVGEEQLQNSVVIGGASGLSCRCIIVNDKNREFDLTVDYRMQVPFSVFPLPDIACEEVVRIKGWSGYEKRELDEDETVYVTESGSVFHRDMFCTYLVASVRTISREELDERRNHSGGKYYLCEVCEKNADSTGRIYITDYGDRYHVSLNCSSLKRVVRAVPYREVSDREGCSKCVK